jgi:hypothetical protein
MIFIVKTIKFLKKMNLINRLFLIIFCLLSTHQSYSVSHQKEGSSSEETTTKEQTLPHFNAFIGSLPESEQNFNQAQIPLRLPSIRDLLESKPEQPELHLDKIHKNAQKLSPAKTISPHLAEYLARQPHTLKEKLPNPPFFSILKDIGLSQTQDKKSPIKKKHLIATCSELTKLYKNKLSNNAQWLGSEGLTPDFFQEVQEKSFQPYIQKHIFDAPQNTQKKIISIADLHGDIGSLVTLLEHFQEKKYITLNPNNTITVTNPDITFVFTGDIVDRGKHGVETLHTVFNFAQHNPDNVIITRGNHEDLDMNLIGGFQTELCAKFKLNPLTKEKHRKALHTIYGSYKYLPAAFFAGIQNQEKTKTRFFKFCHGGFDLGSNPLPLLQTAKDVRFMRIKELKRETNLDQLYQKNPSLDQFKKANDIKIDHPYHVRDISELKSLVKCGLGDIWGDIIFNPKDGMIMRQSDRGEDSVEYGQKLIEALYKESSSQEVELVATIRGHQHNEECMKEIVSHGGAHHAWHQAQPCNTINSAVTSKTMQLKQGDVITVAPAPHGGFEWAGYTYIPYCELDLEKATLTTYQIPVHKQE